MITVKEAQAKIQNNLCSLSSERIKLQFAFKRVLATDIISPVSHPLFNQSAVDGYAVRFKDMKSLKEGKNFFKIVGESKTGGITLPGKFVLKPYETIRIFTGAPVPAGCDTVIMQEDIGRKDNSIVVKTIPLRGANIRNKGGQIKKGMVALRKGSVLNSASLGFLASLGINIVRVSAFPMVSVIVTGNEFAKSAGRLRKGIIYESNGLMLISLLGDLNIKVHSSICKDDLNKLTKLVKRETGKNDIVIISGGVSVGDYDFTKKALKNLEFKIIFHKVFQKPGKPMLFAKKKNKTVFGLPGNPRSVLVCFFEYVYPFIQASMANREPFLKSLTLPLVYNYKKKDDKTLFLTSKLTGNGVQILEGQDSHMLKSFSAADTITCLPEGKKNYSAGEFVNVHILP